VGFLKEGPLRKIFREVSASPHLSDDVFQDIIWALQDIAIIRALENFKEDPRAVALINQYFNLLLHDLLTNDLPRDGLRIEDVNDAKAFIEKARASPIGSNDFDSNLAGADGTFCRFLTEYSERYYKS
jgi:hypothetical protein